MRQEATALKPQLLEAYDGCCAWCGDKLPDGLTFWHAHHLRPVSRGGTSEAANLHPVHIKCHPKAEAVSRKCYPSEERAA